MTDDEPMEPALRVEKGEPTEGELAAVIAVVSARAQTSQAQPPDRPSNWAAYWRSVRAPLSPGPSAWRRSASPR